MTLFSTINSAYNGIKVKIVALVQFEIIGNISIIISKTPKLSDKIFVLTLQHPCIAQKMRNQK